MQKHPQNSLLIAVIVFIASWIPGLFFLRFGVGMHDEAYQILNGIVDWHNSPLAPLSALFTHVIGNLFGTELLVYRYTAFIINAIAVCVVSISVFGRNLVKTLWASGICIWLLGMHWLLSWLYGWDSWTYLSSALCFVALIGYLRNRSVTWLVGLIVITTICSLVRLPNIVVIPICAVAIWLVPSESHKQQGIVYGGVYSLISIFCILLSLLAMYGSIDNYMTVLHANALTNHNSLLYFYYIGLEKTIPIIFTVIAVWVCLEWICGKTSSRAGKLLSCSVLSVLTVISISVLGKHDDMPMLLWNSAAITGCACVIFASSSTRTIKQTALITLCFVLLPTIGSNTGFVKCLSVLLFPMIWSLCRNVFPTNIMRSFLAVVMTVSTLSGTIILSVFSFEDRGLMKSTATITTGKMNGIRTTPQNKQMIESTLNTIDSLRTSGFEIETYGTRMWGWNYLIGTYSPATQHVWNDVSGTPIQIKIEQDFVSRMKKNAGRKVAVIATDTVPAFGNVIPDTIQRSPLIYTFDIPLSASTHP